MPKRLIVNEVYYGNDEMWLKARPHTKDSHEYREFLVIGTELEDVYYSFGAQYSKDDYERVPRPPNADQVLRNAAAERTRKPVWKPAPCLKCPAVLEPQKRRDPRFCGEHQPEGKIPVCRLHGWSVVIPCPDCGDEAPHVRKGGVERVTPDRERWPKPPRGRRSP